MAEIEVRQEKAATWSVLMRDVQRYVGEEGIGTVVSERYTTIQDTLEELAGMLVEEVHDDEADSLSRVTENIWLGIREQLVSWAVDVEHNREARRQSVA